MRRLVDVEHLLKTSGMNFAYAPHSPGSLHANAGFLHDSDYEMGWY